MLLAPLFPDLIDEDSTPKVGPVQPRADIVIPSINEHAIGQWMQMLMLACTHGTEIEIHCEGADEQPALDALVRLVESRFEEE